MSGFTALNGTSPKVATKPVAVTSNSDAQNGTTDEQPNAPVPTVAPTVDVASAPAPPTDSAPVGSPAHAHAHTHAPVQLLAEAPAPVPAPIGAAVADAAATTLAPMQAPAAQSPNPRQSWPTQGLDRTSSAPAPSENDSTNKRKRSDSHEGRTQLPTQPAKRTHKSAERAQERTPETATVVSHHQSNGNHYQTDAQPAGAQAQYQAPPSVPIRAPAEQHRRQSSGQVEYAPSTPQNNNQAVVQYQTPTYSEPRSGAVVQHDPKKRKRNFSNRTKTGCLTCRRRKKKCDEAKPECMSNNFTS